MTVARLLSHMLARVERHTLLVLLLAAAGWMMGAAWALICALVADWLGLARAYATDRDARRSPPAGAVEEDAGAAEDDASVILPTAERHLLPLGSGSSDVRQRRRLSVLSMAERNEER